MYTTPLTDSNPPPQLTFHSLAGGRRRLPPGLQRPGDAPADAILLATHARRCNVHLLNRNNPKSLLYSIQVRACVCGWVCLAGHGCGMID